MPDDPSPLIHLWWILIVFLIILTAIFSGAETAMESCNKFKFKVKASEGSRSAKLVVKILDKFDENLISVLVGYNVVTTIISTIATIYFTYIIAPDFVNLASTIIISVLVYLLGDTLPKICARAVPDTFIKLSSYFLVFFYYIFYPVNKLFYFLSWCVKKIFKIKNDVTLTEEDFSNIVENNEEIGELDEDESDIILNSIDFLDTSVKECFTPANKMEMIDIDNLSNERLNQLLLNSNYSRIPMYYKNRNNIVGILTVKKYFNAYIEDKHVNVKSILNQPYFVDSNATIDSIFEGFNKNKTHLAIVKSKDTVVGMVTMDDLLEELVGEEISKQDNNVGEEL